MTFVGHYVSFSSALSDFQQANLLAFYFFCVELEVSTL